MYVPESQQCNEPNSAQPVPENLVSRWRAQWDAMDDAIRRAKDAYLAGLVRAPSDFAELGSNVMRDVANQNARGAGAIAGRADTAPVEPSGCVDAEAVEVQPLNVGSGTLPHRPDFGGNSTTQGMGVSPPVEPDAKNPLAECRPEAVTGPPSGGPYPANFPATYPAACDAAPIGGTGPISWLWWLAAAGVFVAAAADDTRRQRRRAA